MIVTSPPVATGARRSRAWLWALGCALVVCLVWAGTYVGHHIVASRVLARARVAAPAYPLAAIASVLRPEAGAAFAAAVGDTGELVWLAGQHEAACPPTGGCDAAPALDTLLVVNGRTGTTDAQGPLTGAAQQPVALVVDAQHGLADVVSAGSVDVYALATGAHLNAFALPVGVTAGTTTGAAISGGGTLLLTTRHDGQPALVGLDARLGTPRFSIVPAQGVTRFDGPVYDPASGLLVVLEAGNGGTNLWTLDATHGRLRSVASVPDGARLGPLDAASGMLYLFLPDGATDGVSVAALAGAPPLPNVTKALLTPDGALAGALALGWNAALGHVYVADAGGLRIVDGATGRTLSALPLPVAWPPDVALPVDGAGLLFAPTDHGAVAVVRDTANLAVGLTPDSAALLARAATATLPPQNGADPPFFGPVTFTVGPGTRTDSFYALDPDFGTTGPYPGSARLAVAPTAGSPGAYTVSFSISWYLRFVHTRSWVYAVAPDGAVSLVSQAGDALP